MKNKKTFLILAVVFVILIIGASVLYKQLSGTVENSNLSVKEESSSENENLSETLSDEHINNEDQEITEASETGTSTAKEEYRMPDFTVYDKNGSEVQLSDFIGKPVILNFWASWCGPCKSEMPEFEEAYLTYGDDVEFLMVNLTDGSRETTETACEFIGQQGYTFPVYFDTEQEVAYTYGVYSIPTTYFIDENGNGIAQGTGALDAASLQRGIEMIYPQASALSYLKQAPDA